MSYNSLKASLIRDYLLQDNAASTAVVDSSSNATNGTLTNAGNTSAITTTGPNTWLPAALAFDATNDYVNASHADAYIGSGIARSYEFWVKCRDKTASSNQAMRFGSVRPYISLSFTTDRPFVAMQTNNYRYFAAAATTTMQDLGWHHVVIVMTGNAQNDIDNFQMYLDGALVTAATAIKTAVQDVMDRLWFPYGTANNVAAMAGVAVHPVALDADEVAERYEGPEPLSLTDPVLGTDGVVTSGTWNLQNNGSLTRTTYLYLASDDSLVATSSSANPDFSGDVTEGLDYYVIERGANDGGYDDTQDAQSADTTIAGDTTAPTVDSATINVDGDETTVVFDEAVTGTATGFEFDDATALTYVSGIDSNTLVFSHRVILASETRTLEYDDTVGDMEDLAGNPLETFTAQAVTNDSEVVADTTAPTLTSVTIVSALVIRFVFDEPVTLTDLTGWAMASSGAALTLDSFSGDETDTIDAVPSRPIVSTESLAFSYNSATGDVADMAANVLATIADRLVTNNISATPGSVSLIGPGLIQ